MNRVLSAINEGFSVVIGLTSTGESSALRVAARSKGGDSSITEKQVPLELFESAIEALTEAGGERGPPQERPSTV